MAHEVFISYASADRAVGNAICHMLEARGHRCWIAPRDITPGREWAEAIIEGINGARVFVIVFSTRSNGSQQVLREIERAVNKGLVVIPFRIEDVAPSASLEYYMGVPHWLDALNPPMDQHIEELCNVVSGVLASEGRDAAPPPAPFLRQKKLDPAALAGVAALVAIPGVAALLGSDPPWPVGMGYMSCALVAAAAGLGRMGSLEPARMPRWGKRLAQAAFVLALIAYVALLSRFVEQIPRTDIRVVTGFTCTEDARLVYGSACPALPRDALRDAEWEATMLWTSGSVTLVRLGLVGAWLSFVAGLGLAAASLTSRRIAR